MDATPYHRLFVASLLTCWSVTCWVGCSQPSGEDAPAPTTPPAATPDTTTQTAPQAATPDPIATAESPRTTREPTPAVSATPTPAQPTPMPTPAVPTAATGNNATPQPVITSGGMPRVVLGEQQRKRSKVNVGDAFPTDVTLPAAEGGEQALAGLLSPSHTVVICFSSADPYAVAALDELQHEVFNRWSGNGVGVVGILVGDSAEQVQQVVADKSLTFPILVDADGQFISGLCEVSSELPRIYLLDANGEILWFDIQWSLETERDLLQAISYRLGQ